MKSISKCISILLLIVFINSGTHAQNLGIRVGLNASNLSVKNFDDRKTRWGFNVGLFTEKLLTNSLYVSPEIGYTTKGSSVTFKNLNTKNNFNLNYAELSLPFTYKLNGVNIQLGPYLSYLINVKAKTQNETTQVITEIDKSNYNNFDAGFLVGLNLDLTPNIAIGTRYGLGFVKIARTDASRVALGDARNMVGQISIAYKF